MSLLCFPQKLIRRIITTIYVLSKNTDETENRYNSKKKKNCALQQLAIFEIISDAKNERKKIMKPKTQKRGQN